MIIRFKKYIHNTPLHRDLRAWSLFLLSSGLALTLFPKRIDSASAYRFLLEVFSARIWGVVFMVVGLVILIAIYNRKIAYKYIRIALVASASVFAMWGTGIVLAFIVGSASTPYGIIVYFLLLYIPFSLLKRDPLINPVYRGIP